jgi:hypothetical protein
VNRVTHRSHVLNEAEELFPETPLSVLESQSFPTDYAATPNSTVLLNHSPAHQSSEPKDAGTLTEESEVGIP